MRWNVCIGDGCRRYEDCPKKPHCGAGSGSSFGCKMLVVGCWGEAERGNERTSKSIVESHLWMTHSNKFLDIFRVSIFCIPEIKVDPHDTSLTLLHILGRHFHYLAFARPSPRTRTSIRLCFCKNNGQQLEPHHLPRYLIARTGFPLANT